MPLPVCPGIHIFPDARLHGHDNLAIPAPHQVRDKLRQESRGFLDAHSPIYVEDNPHFREDKA